LLIIGRAADIDRVRQEVLDDALMPERAEHRRDAQIVETRGNLTGGDRFRRVPPVDQPDVLDPLVKDRRPVLQGLVKGFGRSVALAVEPLRPSIGVDLDSLVMALIDHPPHFLALSIEGHHVAAVGTVAAEEVALAGERQLAGQHAGCLLALLP